MEEKKGDKNGGLWIPRKDLRDAVSGATLSGVTGELHCDENGDCNLNAIGVYQAQGGAFIPLNP